MTSEIVHLMMTLRDQVKLYHWQTMNYPRHIATNDLVTKLDTNIDQFVREIIRDVLVKFFTCHNLNSFLTYSAFIKKS